MSLSMVPHKLPPRRGGGKRRPRKTGRKGPCPPYRSPHAPREEISSRGACGLRYHGGERLPPESAAFRGPAMSSHPLPPDGRPTRRAFLLGAGAGLAAGVSL